MKRVAKKKRVFLTKLVRYISKKDFLWWGLRISFWGMIGVIFFSSIDFLLDIFFHGVYYYETTSMIPSILIYSVIFAISSVVFSIINLVKKKEKLFPIIVLISSIIIIIAAYICWGYYLKNIDYIRIAWENFVEG